VSNQQKTARNTYNRLSRWYDVLAASEWTPIQAALQLLAPQAGERVLEIGCGSGRALPRLSEYVGPSGQVYGLDISDGMLEQSRLRLAPQTLNSVTASKAKQSWIASPGRVQMDNIFLTQANAGALPLTAAQLDAILMAFTLEAFPCAMISTVLAECRRVLRPAGRLCLLYLYKPAESTRSIASYEWFHRRWPAIIDCRPINLEGQIASMGFVCDDFKLLNFWTLPLALGLYSTQF
jgi:ubiquinone/menaquinone biosynthesis C-methylase UbiE